MSVADEIKSKLDIVSYVQQYVPLKRAGRTWKAPCPFHSERSPSFSVDPERQSWRCYGACSEGGDVISFAMKRNGWSFSEALEELGKLAGVEVRKQTPEQRAQYEQLDHLRGLLGAAADAFHELLLRPDDAGAAAALAYAREKRGFSDETIQRFGIGYAPPGFQNMLELLKLLGYSEDQIIEAGMAVRNDKGRVYDRFRNRLMIPIRDERGRVTGFGARALDPEDMPKYLNSPQTALFDKSHTLFGLDVAKKTIADTGTAVIVEGYMDAIQAHQAGFSNVIAQMGTALTETQLKLIAPKWAKKIVLALDSDAAGQNATLRSLEVARQTLQADYSGRLSVDMRVLHIPDAKDPDDLIRESPERWAALVEGATPVADYVIEAETHTLPPQASVQEREAAARRLLPMLLASENNLYKKDNLQKLALRLRIPERDLLAWADEQLKIQKAAPPRKQNHPQPPAPSSPLRREGEQNPGSSGGYNGSGRKAADLHVLDAPPEFPPLDYEAEFIPPPLDDEGEVYSRPIAPGRTSTPPLQPVRTFTHTREAAMEDYCLRTLLLRPDAFYAVNRKLREMAGAMRKYLDERGMADYVPMVESLLGDWDAEDFTGGACRELMHAFGLALAQDEMEPLAYLRAGADDLLQSQLDMLLTDELDGLKARVRGGLPADMDASYNQNRRTTGVVDMNAEVIEKALRLRGKRLQREREELCFLQMDAAAEGDSAAGSQLQAQIVVSSIAKGLIEAELQKHLSLLRE